MDFVDKLKEKYGTDTPIIAGEVELEGMNEESIRQNLSRQARAGRLQKYAQGIYYITEQSNSKITDQQVYEKRFISDGVEVYGYYAGKSFEYELGIIKNAPEVVEIVTNKETSRGREVKIGNTQVRIKKGYAEINNRNKDILSLLSYINQVVDLLESRDIIIQYAQENNIKVEDVFDWLAFYPSKVSKKVIESGLFKVSKE